MGNNMRVILGPCSSKLQTCLRPVCLNPGAPESLRLNIVMLVRGHRQFTLTEHEFCLQILIQELPPSFFSGPRDISEGDFIKNTIFSQLDVNCCQ